MKTASISSAPSLILDAAIPKGEHRYQALDSLRGFASLTVVLMHLSMLTPLVWLSRTPARIFLGGHEAVILFFVLSGYVLTLQVSSYHYRYLAYLTKRICRIYIPYFVALSVALLLVRIVHGRSMGLGAFFASSWPDKLTASQIFSHFALIFPFDSRTLNPVIWTLAYEMRISIIFPLLVVAATKFGTKRMLAVSFLASAFVALVMVREGKDLKLASLNVEWLPTIHYVLMFMSGCVLALSREKITGFLTNGRLTSALFVSGAIVYIAAQKLSAIHHLPMAEFIWDWLVTAAVCGLIACLANANRYSAALRSRPFLFLGHISYSLYLYHLLILHVVFYLLFPRLPLSVSVVTSLALGIITAYISYIAIERPSIALGNRFAKGSGRRRASKVLASE